MTTVEEIQQSAEAPSSRGRKAGAQAQRSPFQSPKVPGLRDGRDLVLDNALKAIDPAVARSFDEEQRRALRTLLGLRGNARHLLDLRRSLRFGGRRYYIAFLFGRERRHLSNRKAGLGQWLRDHAITLAGSSVLLIAIFALAAYLRS